MSTEVTIGSARYAIEKLESGNIRVTHEGGQIHQMQGPGTDGIHVFEVHPCQNRWYGYWNAMLPTAEQSADGPGAGGATPWWSSKGWKKKEGKK